MCHQITVNHNPQKIIVHGGLTETCLDQRHLSRLSNPLHNESGVLSLFARLDALVHWQLQTPSHIV